MALRYIPVLNDDKIDTDLSSVHTLFGIPKYSAEKMFKSVMDETPYHKRVKRKAKKIVIKDGEEKIGERDNEKTKNKRYQKKRESKKQERKEQNEIKEDEGILEELDAPEIDTLLNKKIREADEDKNDTDKADYGENEDYAENYDYGENSDYEQGKRDEKSLEKNILDKLKNTVELYKNSDIQRKLPNKINNTATSKLTFLNTTIVSTARPVKSTPASTVKHVKTTTSKPAATTTIKPTGTTTLKPTETTTLKPTETTTIIPTTTLTFKQTRAVSLKPSQSTSAKPAATPVTTSRASVTPTVQQLMNSSEGM